MITISLCMIVKNEEDTLERCLMSVGNIADEVIIVDTGSTDRTVEIAERYTPHVFHFEWTDDFSEARNFSFSQATKEYIFWLDADDILLPDDLLKMQQMKQSFDHTLDAVSMDYHIAFDSNGNVISSSRRFRLVKRSKHYQWRGAVHEMLVVSGKAFDSDIVVTHKKEHPITDRNLNIYENLLNEGKPFTQQDLFHYARELHHRKRYEEAAVNFLKFLNDPSNTPETRIYALQQLADCYHMLGDTEKELASTFQSFRYDIPRPESCCRLGYFFLKQNAFRQAIFWYKLATDFPLEENRWAIVNNTSRTMLPHIQLGLCYFRLGQYEQAYHHNKIALEYLPNDKDILNNILVLEELLQKQSTGVEEDRCSPYTDMHNEIDDRT